MAQKPVILNEPYKAILECSHCGNEYTATIDGDHVDCEYCDDCWRNAPLHSAYCFNCKEGGYLSLDEIPNDGKCSHCGADNLWVDGPLNG